MTDIADQPKPGKPIKRDKTPAEDTDGPSLAEIKRSEAAKRKAIAAEMEELRTAHLAKELDTLKRVTEGKGGTRGMVASSQFPVVGASRLAARHMQAVLLFVLLVIAPVWMTQWYLTERAVVRYVSVAGFSVRTEEASSAFDLLSGIGGFSSQSSSDTDILFSFIQSPTMVARAHEELDLVSIWAREDIVDRDPIFAFDGEPTLEELTDYWGRRVKVYSDVGTGLIDLEVEAYSAEDALALARFIYDESSRMINRLSTIAQTDATRFAREELTTAETRLREARDALTAFRNRTQIVDPAASIQGQMGILTSLQGQLAEALVDLDLLSQTTTATDPRIAQLQARVEAIEARISEERRKLGIGIGAEASTNPDDRAFADLVGEFETLTVDLEIAQTAYMSALSNYDTALSDARRQTRYLAAHVEPTLPQSATRPRTSRILIVVALGAFMVWTVVVLVGYSLRDRR